MMAHTTRLCRICGNCSVFHHGRCRVCDEAYRLDKLGACPRCVDLGLTRAIWARGLCNQHHRQEYGNRVVEKVGYTGNADNRDDYNDLVQGLIAAMIAVGPHYLAWVNGHGDYRHPDVRVMEELIVLARTSLRPRTYVYVLRRVNAAFPARTGIPLPRAKETPHEIETQTATVTAFDDEPAAHR